MFMSTIFGVLFDCNQTLSSEGVSQATENSPKLANSAKTPERMSHVNSAGNARDLYAISARSGS